MAWLAAALLSSVIGLLQFFGVSAQFKPWINVTALGDAFGNLRQRNQFASLTSVGLVVLLWGPLAGMWRHQDHGRHAGSELIGGLARPLAWLAVVLLAMANAASSSRTGALQLFVLPVLAWGWRLDAQRTVVPRLVVALAVYVLASIALPLLAGLDPLHSGIGGRFGDADRACGSRTLLWSNVLHLIAQKPWFGWGWGELDYAHFVTLYAGDRFCDILDNAHNLPLHLAVELGVPVALLACGLVGWLVLRARPWRERNGQRRMAWAVLALIGLHSLLEYPLWYGPFQIAAVLAIWILWRTPGLPHAQMAQDPGVGGKSNSGSNASSASSASVGSMSSDRNVASFAPSCRPERKPFPERTAFAPSAAALAGLALIGAAYAAWDYQRVSQIYRQPAQRSPGYRDDTLAKIGDSWLFRNQVRFAALTLSSVTPGNAQAIHREAQALLHFSPEARVVEKLIESALLLGDPYEAALSMRRYRAAYPVDYARWRATRASVPQLPRIDP